MFTELKNLGHILRLIIWRSKLYHFCSNRRDIYISELRKFETICLKITKLHLDILYFERCINLRICPKFLSSVSIKKNEVIKHSVIVKYVS